MIGFEKKILDNGLKVLVHPDRSTPFAAVNLIYDVGSRDEAADRTGFAHLFEHLMFGGSVNAPDYDTVLQRIGGVNNAFTSTDVTNYYLTLPAPSVEVGLWLESDRMFQLDLSQKALDSQIGVVSEEFRQNYINQPYGDVWHLIRSLTYKIHPYRWPTIGSDVQHIADASLDDVQDFYKRFYAPNNAALVISGNVDSENIFELSNRWFGDIEPSDIAKRDLPQEPEQTERRELTVERDVPLDMFIFCWHMGDKVSDDYICGDLISDILSCGASSRLNQELIQKRQLFVEIDAFISGDSDPGLFIVIGKPNTDVDVNVAKQAILDEMDRLKSDLIGEYELTKVMNKFESELLYTSTSYLDKAMHLAAFELLGSADMANEQVGRYRSTTASDLQNFCNKVFVDSNCSVINYLAKR